MTIRMKNTLHGMMVATVAGSILLTGCGPSREEVYEPRMSGELAAPKNNPKFAGSDQASDDQAAPEMADMRAPEGNMSADVGAEYEVAEMKEPYPQPQQQESGNFFTSLFGGKNEPAVDTTQRRVPALNKDGGDQASPMETASYEAAAPVEQVIEVQDAEMGAGAMPAPQSEIIVAEEVAALDEPFAPRENATLPKTYPSLATVPARPERIEAVREKEGRMADLADARSGSAAQQQALETQVAQEKEGSLLPQQSADEWQQPVQVAQPEAQPAHQQDVEAEFAALVAAEQPKIEALQEEPAAAQTPVAEAAQAQPWDVPAEATYQAPAPVEMAPAQPQVTVSQAEPVQIMPQAQAVATQQPVVIQPQAEQQQAMPTQWQAAPQVVPQNAVPVQEDQWVSLQQDPAAQMAAPVDGVTVGGAPEVVAVSPIPVVPEGGAAAGGIELTPPSAYGRAVRTLPDSRYAARRQAVYMQRYARQVQANEGF